MHKTSRIRFTLIICVCVRNLVNLCNSKFLLQSDIVYHNLNPIKLDYLYSTKLHIIPYDVEVDVCI